MSRRYIAFDIETAKALPQEVGNLKSHRPLGICCAAALAENEAPRLWHGVSPDGRPAPRMSQPEAAEMVRELLRLADTGATILTWNGASFDFDILAEESGLWDECRLLARSHVDMMFHALCELGYPIGLDSACRGMGLAGKSGNVQQYLAPQYWADGRTDEVLEYVTGDVRATLAVALEAERQGKLKWIARSGKTRDFRLTNGWLSVEEAQRLPLPDTSWMDRPISRASFLSWLRQ
ncbi:MAG: hypothetical protein R3B90_00910 [Planctomycetaceae bacterium]